MERDSNLSLRNASSQRKLRREGKTLFNPFTTFSKYLGRFRKLVAPTLDPGIALAYVAAAIAMAGGLIGTGIAQSGIGAAGMGVVAEKPERQGTVLFFLVIPETLFIFGFVVALIIMLGILKP
jgi:V/A-type H+/Na+-transporting ATPase subunit K